MNRHAWLLVSGCAWAVMMFLLFHREIRPFFEYQQPPTYASVFRHQREPEVQRRAVYFAQSRIGNAETLSEPLEAGGFRMKSRLAMDMRPFGGPTLLDTKATMASEIRLDSAFQLSEFHLNGKMQGIPVTARGDRQGNKLHLSYNLVLLKGNLLVDFPRDATLADNFLPYQGGGKMEEGKKWKMKMFDLGNLVAVGKDQQVELTELYAWVTGREKPPSSTEEKLAWVVDIRRQPTDEYWTYLLWVDEDGTVLEQHMKINKQPCRIVLEERRKLSAEDLKSFQWSVER